MFEKVSTINGRINKESKRQVKLIMLLMSFSFLLLFISNSSFGASQSVSKLTLSDVLEAALAIQNTNTQEIGQPAIFKSSSTWLASSPILGVSYLKSDQPQGVDEIEFNLSLPIKSSRQTNVDKTLVNSSKALQGIFKLNQKLQLSGLIRSQVWDISIAQMNVNNLKQKLSFLSSLEQQYQQLFRSSAATKYPLLLIQKEMLDAEVEKLTYLEIVSNLHIQYQSLTGIKSLPTDIIEDDLAIDSIEIVQHPFIQKLDHEWYELQQIMKLDSNEAESWSLSVTAKQLESDSVNETQIGIAAHIPINVFEFEKQSLSSEWKLAKGNYDLTRNAQLVDLQQRYQSLVSQQEMLSKKEALLIQSKVLSKAIIKETQLLIDANQIEQGQAIRRMLNAFSTKSQLKLIQLSILKSSAMLRQAAGVSL